MKKIYRLLFLCIGMAALFTSCGGGDEFTLKGTLGTEKGETFLVLFDDPIAKIDTIRPIEGAFEYSFIPDTTTLMRLVSKEGKTIPVFAEKGWEVTCKGTFDTPQIDGDGHNHDYHEFLQSIKGLNEQDTIAVIAEKFIRKHPHSFASAYLIDQYFIQVDEPDAEKVNSLVTPLNGEVKDSRILNVAMKSIPTDKKNEEKSLNYFSLRDRNGKYISWGIKDGQYILINFWASWDKKSLAFRNSTHDIAAKLPKNRVKVLNISLDYNRDKWLEKCKEDTDYWIEICALNGWEAPIVKQNNVLGLPSNILIDSQRKILAKDIFGKALADKLDKPSKD